MEYQQHVLTIGTHRQREIVDITEAVSKRLPFIKKPSSRYAVRPVESMNEAHNGLCFLFITHTTAAITSADLDPGTDLDMLDAFEEMVPKLNYRHPHDPSHVPDHIISALIGSSLTIPIKGGKLMLGTWQRVILVEFDGPRERDIIISTI